MLFKRTEDTVDNTKLKDKEYFKEYIRSLKYGEFVSLIEAFFEVSQETAKLMGAARSIGKKNKKDDGRDDYIR